MAKQIREGRFNFLAGRRWSDWENTGLLIQEGALEVRSAAALVGDRLPPAAEERVRQLEELANGAAGHAFEVASAYAGYDVTERPKLPRYMPSDRDVGDLAGFAAYSSFGSEFTTLLCELDGMAAPSPMRPAKN